MTHSEDTQPGERRESLRIGADLEASTTEPPGPFSVRRIVQLIAFATIVVLPIVLMGMTRRGSVLQSVVTGLTYALQLLGIVLITSGWFKRNDSSIRCAACDYARPPIDPVPRRCSECGADWTAPDAFRTGTAAPHWPRILLGVLLIVGSGAVRLAGVHSGLPPRLLPTGSLIREIIDAPRGFTLDEWAELRNRTLSQEQRLRLASGLLDRRERTGYLSNDDEQWLDTVLQQRLLTREIVNRLFAELIEFWIIAPSQTTSGSEVTLAIGSRAAHSRTWAPQVWMAGFTVGENPTLLGAQDKLVVASLLGRERYFHQTHPDRRPGLSPEVTITTGPPGPLRVRAHLVLIALPQAISEVLIERDTSGHVVRPPEALWFEERTLEHVIQVR
jgi:hypothetical protein